jgi:hypothetical protein
MPLSEIMRRAEPDTVLADGLRGCLRDLDDAIRHCRICIRKNSPRKAEFLSEYLRLIRLAHERKDEYQAQSHIWQPLCEPHMPMPFAEQIVGANKFARSWNMALMASPAEAVFKALKNAA